MFKHSDLKKLGGLFVYQTTLDYLQTAYAGVLDALADSYGDLVIVSGLEVTGNQVTDGWVVYNKQLYPVVGGALQQYLYEDIVIQGEQFQDGSTKNVYSTKRLAFTSTNTGIEWGDLHRLPFATTSLYDAFVTIQGMFSRLVYNEPVILAGCEVTNVNEANKTLQIAKGDVYIGGRLLATPAYSGAYNVFLNADGNFTTTQPKTPYIQFDYETSQRYADVMRRNNARSGQVVMHTNPDELAYFDAAGIGRWRWLGWRISPLLQSRTPIGYDTRTSNPGGVDTKAWNTSNRAIGNKIGSNSVMLKADNIPPLSGDVQTELNGTDGTTENGNLVYNGDQEGNGSGWKDGRVRINNGVQQTEVDIRQASASVLFIEKI